MDTLKASVQKQKQAKARDAVRKRMAAPKETGPVRGLLQTRTASRRSLY
jgi:hypothetical protein